MRGGRDGKKSHSEKNILDLLRSPYCVCAELLMLMLILMAQGNGRVGGANRRSKWSNSCTDGVEQEKGKRGGNHCPS